jgi:hypothetical protein
MLELKGLSPSEVRLGEGLTLDAAQVKRRGCPLAA